MFGEMFNTFGTGVPAIWSGQINRSDDVEDSVYLEQFSGMAKTVRSLYLTYDYSEDGIKKYFNDTDCLSSVINNRSNISTVTAVKVANDNLGKNVDYIDSLLDGVRYFRQYVPTQSKYTENPGGNLAGVESQDYSGISCTAHFQSDLVQQGVDFSLLFANETAPYEAGFIPAPIAVPNTLALVASAFVMTTYGNLTKMNSSSETTRESTTTDTVNPEGLNIRLMDKYYSKTLDNNKLIYKIPTEMRYVIAKFCFGLQLRLKTIKYRTERLNGGFKLTLLDWLMGRMYDPNILGDYFTGLNYDAFKMFAQFPLNRKPKRAPSFFDVTFQTFYTEPVSDLGLRKLKNFEGTLRLSGLDSIIADTVNNFSDSLSNYTNKFSNTQQFSPLFILNFGFT